MQVAINAQKTRLALEIVYPSG